MKPLDEKALAELSGDLARGPVEMTRKRVVGLTQARIQTRTPTAIVRFGEGEARILASESQDPESMKIASNKLRRQTGRFYEPDDVLRIKSIVMHALDRADILGLRGDSSFKPEHDMWIKRVESIFAERITAGRDSAVVTHCLVNNDLRDNLATLVAGRNRLSVISCRDLAPWLSDEYGIADVSAYQVPSQYIMRHVDGEYEAGLHDVTFWPEFYFELRNRLTVREPGEVFLVGAGILGKGLCMRIKELGGIALDMGSCLDGMAGKVTRGAGRPEPYKPPKKRGVRLPRRRRT